MKSPYKDWRNYALAIAAIVILVLVSSLFAMKSGSRTLVFINNRVAITEGQVLDELKHNFGNEVYTRLIDDAVTVLYAEQQGLDAMPEEVEQFITWDRFNMLARGESLEDELKAQGMTLDDYRRKMRVSVLRAKLVTTEDDRKADFAQYGKELTIPPVYRVKQFIFADPESAQKAYDLLSQPDSGAEKEQEASMMAVNENPLKVQTYMPGGQMNNPLMNTILAGLKPGQVSKPTALPAEAENTAARIILKLVDARPGEEATLENRGILISYLLMSRPDGKYAMKIKQVQAEALNNVDINFVSDDYPHVRESFKSTRLQNPNVPRFNPNAQSPLPGMPGSGQ